MEKYIMLRNYDHDEYGTEMIDVILSMFPEAKVEDYSICRPHGEVLRWDDGLSIWIPEEQFLSAWMFANLHITKADSEISKECTEEFLIEETIQDGIDYMNKNLNDPELFVHYY